MTEQARKMSEILKEMSETLLRKMPEDKFPKVTKQEGKSPPPYPDEDGEAVTGHQRTSREPRPWSPSERKGPEHGVESL